jgi:hypothetical protein
VASEFHRQEYGKANGSNGEGFPVEITNALCQALDPILNLIGTRDGVPKQLLDLRTDKNNCGAIYNQPSQSTTSASPSWLHHPESARMQTAQQIRVEL